MPSHFAMPVHPCMQVCIDLAQGLQLVDGEGLLLLNQAADLEAEVLEVVLAQGDVLLGLLLCRRARVDPVERGNIVLSKGLPCDLARLQAVDRERANRLRSTPDPALGAAQVRQGPVGGSDPQGDGDDDADDQHGDGLSELCRRDVVVVFTEHHVRDVVLRVDDEHEGDVHDHEEAVERHAQEVDRTRRLTVAEDLDIPGEASREGGGHDGAGRDHEGRDDEDDREVHELLEGVIGLEMLDGGNLQAHVDLRTLPCLGEDGPRGGDDAPPLARPEEEGDVHEAVNEPDGRDERVPRAAQADLSASGKGDQRVQVALVVARRELAGDGRHLVLGELEPFGSGCAVIVPVQTRVRCEDLPARADEETHHDEVDEVGDPQPSGKRVEVDGTGRAGHCCERVHCGSSCVA